jgi:hypothetical protein
MTKYSFQSKLSNEAISITEARSLDEATEIFAKIKDLSLDKFTELGEY